MKPENVKERIDKNRKRERYTKVIIYAMIIIVIWNILLICISSALNKNEKYLFGLKAYIITTDSMKPHINSGDVIIISKVSEENLKVGDVITFKKDEEVITHRIIKINKSEENDYITKGDNNNIEDQKSISYKDIEGRKVLRIPFLGKIIMKLQDEVYIIILIIIALVLYLKTQITEDKHKMRREKKKKEDEKFENKENN